MSPSMRAKRDSRLRHFANLRPIEHTVLKFVFANRTESLKSCAPLAAVRIGKGSQVANDLPGHRRARLGRIDFEGLRSLQADFQRRSRGGMNGTEDTVVPRSRSSPHAFANQVDRRRN